MKVLLTGGAGFIASHIADLLLEKGYEVAIVDNFSAGRKENINPGAIFYQADIRSSEIEEIIKKEKPLAVIHHAAQVSVRNSVEDPGYDLDVNIKGSVNLLEKSVKLGVKNFIFASTGGALYGEQDYFPADEDHPLRPLCPYGIAKLSVEKYLYFYQQTYGLNYVTLRYGNVYGPRQDPHGEAGVVAIFSQKMAAGEQPVINGTGEQTRDYVYVGDVARANLLALENNAAKGEFNIGTGIETSVNTLFAQLKLFIGAKTEKLHGEAKKGEQFRSVLFCGKARKELGWEPLVSVKEGLEKTAAYFQSLRDSKR